MRDEGTEDANSTWRMKKEKIADITARLSSGRINLNKEREITQEHLKNGNVPECAPNLDES